MTEAGRGLFAPEDWSVAEPPHALPRWPDADRRTRLVFITRGLGKDAVAHSFAVAVVARS